MAKTESEILFNYKQAIRQAQKLEEAARKLERLSSDRIENTLGMLRQAWQSDNSFQYCSKAVRVQQEIEATAAYIRKIADGIRTTAESVRRAELRALEIARTRTYK